MTFPLPLREMSARARTALIALATCIFTVACSGAEKSAPVAGDVAIIGATVIDGTDSAPLANQTIVITGDSIVAIGPSTSIAPSVATTIDARGKYVIPGMWDNHVHLANWNEDAFPLFVVNGVTTVRSVGDSIEFVRAWRDSSAKKLPYVPNLLIAGPILDDELIVRGVAGTPLGSGRWAVSDSVSGVKAVDSLAKLGVDVVKVHALTPRAAYNGIIAAAKSHNIPVVGHVPDNMMTEDAIAAGQRTIEHDSEVEMQQTPRGRAIHDWMYAKMIPAIASNRAKQRPNYMEIVQYRFAAADSATASFDSATAVAFSKKVAALPVWFDPTSVVMEIVYRGREPSAFDTTALRYVPKRARGFSDGGETSGPPPSQAEMALGRQKWSDAKRSIRFLAQGGAKLITGTDVPIAPLVPGFSLQTEVSHLVDAGLTPKQAIQAATRNSAEAAGKLATSGTVERGKRADLVILDADPLAQIANTMKISAVVSHGHVLTRAALDSVLHAYEVRAKQ